MIAKTEAVNIERVENNIHLARKRKTKWISQDTKIREAQAEVASTPPTKTVYDFRSMLAYKYPNMNHLNLCEDEEDLVGLESEMPAHLVTPEDCADSSSHEAANHRNVKLLFREKQDGVRGYQQVHTTALCKRITARMVAKEAKNHIIYTMHGDAKSAHGNGQGAELGPPLFKGGAYSGHGHDHCAALAPLFVTSGARGCYVQGVLTRRTAMTDVSSRAVPHDGTYRRQF
ncbi:hypothetical protein J6590_098003 [Homalodisca vitripennis]|nr:hypothetical protein J6590_098003 [Homalodisca vitripennis]